MRFPDEFYGHLARHTLVGIRVGPGREAFLDIWMVEVQGRVFARSWNRSHSGWFGALLQGQAGEVRFGEREAAVRGERPDPEAGLMERIDQAYLERFTQPGNVAYARAISRPEYHPFTIELVPVRPRAFDDGS